MISRSCLPEAPIRGLMTLLSGAHAAMMKKGIAEAVDRKDTKFLVGTGPFKFKSYTPGWIFRPNAIPLLEAWAAAP